MTNMDPETIATLAVIAGAGFVIVVVMLFRCWTQGKPCPSRCRIDGKVALITGADSAVGIELVRELCKRGAERVIMGVTNVELGQDVAVDIRGETNGDIVVEYCDMTSLRSVRSFCSKILETESRLHILVNNSSTQWTPLRRTTEGHEQHWGVNHLSHFLITQQLLPLLQRGAPDARIITVSSSLHKRGKIHWQDPNYSLPNHRKYRANEAFSQSKLANVLFTRELARRLDGTGVNAYAVDPGPVATGLGVHILPGLGFCGSLAAICCWIPFLRSAENGTQTTIYCATDSNLAEQSGLYYSDCSVHLTSDRGANMDDAYKLWEMSERMAGQ